MMTVTIPACAALHKPVQTASDTLQRPPEGRLDSLKKGGFDSMS
jgi:hypothetical protein